MGLRYANESLTRRGPSPVPNSRDLIAAQYENDISSLLPKCCKMLPKCTLGNFHVSVHLCVLASERTLGKGLSCITFATETLTLLTVELSVQMVVYSHAV